MGAARTRTTPNRMIYRTVAISSHPQALWVSQHPTSNHLLPTKHLVAEEALRVHRASRSRRTNKIITINRSFFLREVVTRETSFSIPLSHTPVTLWTPILISNGSSKSTNQAEPMGMEPTAEVAGTAMQPTAAQLLQTKTSEASIDRMVT